MNRFSCFLPQNHHQPQTGERHLSSAQLGLMAVIPPGRSNRGRTQSVDLVSEFPGSQADQAPVPQVVLLGGPYFYFGHLKFSFHPPPSPRVTSWMKVVAKRYCSLSGPEFVAWQLKVLEHSIRKKAETSDPRVNLPAQISPAVGLWQRLWVADGGFPLLKEGFHCECVKG